MRQFMTNRYNLRRLVTENVVRRNARLPTVDHFAPDDTTGSDVYVYCLVNVDGTKKCNVIS